MEIAILNLQRKVNIKSPMKMRRLMQLEFWSTVTRYLLSSVKDGSSSEDFEDDNGTDSNTEDFVTIRVKKVTERNHLIERATDGKARRCKHCHKHTTQICKR